MGSEMCIRDSTCGGRRLYSGGTISGALVKILNSFGADFSSPKARVADAQPVASNAAAARAENKHVVRNIASPFN